MQIRKGKQPGPRKILLYGAEGVGKSSWANEAPKPLFLNIEDGLNDIDCESTDLLGTLAEVINAVSWLVNTPHDYKTVVVDTLDWLEKLIHKDVASTAGKPTVGEIAYGKGYDLAVKKWDFLLGGFNALHKKGMGIIFLAHDRIVKVHDPGVPTYERREPDLHSSSGPMIREWCQEVLFAAFRVFTRTEDAGFGRERTIALGGKERFIQTVKSAGVVAKNRVDGLPEEIPMKWADFAKYVAAARVITPANNINGIVIDGSSKTGVA